MVAATHPLQPGLVVLITTDCGGCGRAIATAEAFARERPDVAVRILDVSLEQAPEGVILVGTPMYVDDTRTPRVLSLGNPHLVDLLRHYEGLR